MQNFTLDHSNSYLPLPTSINEKNTLNKIEVIQGKNQRQKSFAKKHFLLITGFTLIFLILISVPWRPKWFISKSPIKEKYILSVYHPVINKMNATEKNSNKNKESIIRKNLSKLITVTLSNYAYGVFGGIKNLTIQFHNNSGISLDEVTAKIIYIKSNGKIWKSKVMSIKNLPGHTDKNIKMPNVGRGRDVKVEMLRVISKKMNLIFDEGKNISKGNIYFSN